MLVWIAGEQVREYPFDMTRARLEALFPEVSFPQPITLESLEDVGIYAVAPLEPPSVEAEEIAYKVAPVLIEGTWTQQWAVRDKTPEELAEAKQLAKAAVSRKLGEIFQSGFTPAAGPLAGRTLQTRDMEDRTNWLTSQAAYSAAVAAGQGGDEGAVFRTAANETVVTTYQNGLLTLLAMAAWGKAIMGHSWSLKDEIEAAETFAALEAIDIEAGWPS